MKNTVTAEYTATRAGVVEQIRQRAEELRSQADSARTERRRRELQAEANGLDWAAALLTRTVVEG